MVLWTLHRGDSPLIVDVPHAGTHIPDAIAMRLTDEARAVVGSGAHLLDVPVDIERDLRVVGHGPSLVSIAGCVPGGLHPAA